MSKFFRALENAEKERAVETATPAAQDTAITTVVDAPPTVREAPVAVDTTPTVEPAPRATNGSAKPVNGSAKPANGSAKPSAPPATPRAPEPMAESPAQRVATRAAHQPVYGSAVSRDSGGSRAHQRVFVGELEPEPTAEARAMDDHLVSLLEPTGFIAEQYRTVRLAVETFRREHGLQIVGVSSPGRGEGKTVTAINVAGALAQAPDARVALVDADLRHPRIAEYLGLPPGRGLTNYLLEPTLSVDAILAKPTAMAISVVVAGPVSSMPYELLKSPRLSGLLAALRERFDFVVVDTPPVLAFPDVGILRDMIDGFIVVVRANRTPREGVTDGLDTLGRHRVVGLVFNDDDRHAAATSAAQPTGTWRKYLPGVR